VVRFGGDSTCRGMKAYVPSEAAEAFCPGSNRIRKVGADGRTYVTCASDCRETGTAQYFCTSQYTAHGSCDPSFQYFSHYLTDSYTWQHDDKRLQVCNFGAETHIILGGNPDSGYTQQLSSVPGSVSNDGESDSKETQVEVTKSQDSTSQATETKEGGL
jgi:hypothetical protein